MTLEDRIHYGCCFLYNGQPIELQYRIDAEGLTDDYSDETGLDIDGLICELRQKAEELEYDYRPNRDLAEAMRVIASEIEENREIPACITIEYREEEEPWWESL